MKTTAWPFLVSRNYYLDYRTVVAPDFIYEARITNLLARITEGELTPPETAVYREIHGSPIGDFAVFFRIAKATKLDIQAGENHEALKDPFGREIYVIEGLVIRENCRELLLTSAAITAAHNIVMSAYHQFWKLTEPAPAQSVGSFDIPIATDSEPFLDLKRLEPFIVEHFSSSTLRTWTKLILKRTLDAGFSVNSIAFSPEGEHVAARCNNQNVQQWSLNQLDKPETLLELQVDELPSTITYSPDGRLLVCGSYLDRRNIVWRWNRFTNEKEKPLYERKLFQADLMPGTLLTVAFSSDSRFLAGGSKEGRLLIWDLERQEKKDTLAQKLTAINAIAFSPNGETLVSGEQNGTIRFWKPGSRLDLPLLQSGLPPITSLAFSPDSKLLACSCADDIGHACCIIWVMATREQRILLEQKTAINCVAFSSDSRILVIASQDGSIWLWDLEKEQEVFAVTAHQGAVTTVAFCPTKPILASGSKDGTIKLWELG